MVVEEPDSLGPTVEEGAVGVGELVGQHEPRKAAATAQIEQAKVGVERVTGQERRRRLGSGEEADGVADVFGERPGADSAEVL